MDQTFEKRKKVMLDFISDDLYVPMKIREIAAVLQIPREQRGDLKAVLDALVDDGKISLSKRGKYSRGETVRLKGAFSRPMPGASGLSVRRTRAGMYIFPRKISAARSTGMKWNTLSQGRRRAGEKRGRSSGSSPTISCGSSVSMSGAKASGSSGRTTRGM